MGMHQQIHFGAYIELSDSEMNEISEKLWESDDIRRTGDSSKNFIVSNLIENLPFHDGLEGEGELDIDINCPNVLSKLKLSGEALASDFERVTGMKAPVKYGLIIYWA